MIFYAKNSKDKIREWNLSCYITRNCGVFGAASYGVSKGLQALGDSGTLTRAGIALGKNAKILSLNNIKSSGTEFAGGTLLKIGKIKRIDVEVGKMLHYHVEIFGRVFDHKTLAWISGLVGGTKGGLK